MPKKLDKTAEAKIKKELLELIRKGHKLPKIEWIRTGLHALDLMIGNGIPLARIIEVFGTESSGKSLLALLLIKVFQKLGWVVMLDDLERTYNPEFMQELGVDPELIIMLKARTIEELRDEVRDRTLEVREIDKNVPILVVVDSVANITSNGEWEKGDFDTLSPADNVGARAQAMSKFMRQFTIFLADNNVTLFAVNQVREKIGIVYGNKEDSPGGRAMKFGASVRIRINRGAKIVLNEREIGYYANVFIEKNKVGPPHRGCKIEVLHGQSYSPTGGLLDILEQAGRIKPVKGGKFEFGDKQFDNEDIERVVGEHPDLIKEWLNGGTNPVGSSEPS